MPHPLRALALSLGLGLAATLGACGSDDAQESGATVPPLAVSTPTSARTTTQATTPTTGTTTVAPDTSTSTAPATTPAPTGGATQPSTTPHSPGGAPAGCPSEVGGFIRDVRTSGTDCGVARSVAAAWFDAIQDGAAPDAPIDAAGYACNATMSGERASVTCSGSGGSVAFTASP